MEKSTHEAEKPKHLPDEHLKDLAHQIQTSTTIVRKWKSLSTQDCIISCVDPLLRSVKDGAYRPQFVIIGPLRCYDSMLENMEIQKRIYLDSFLGRAVETTGAGLDDFCQLIKASAPKILACYEDVNYRHYDFQRRKIRQDIRPSDDKLPLLIEMILVDACFIIELFLRSYFKEKKHPDGDSVFDKPGKTRDLRRDLFLAHNQLPLFILKEIYRLAFGQNPPSSFLHLTCHFFNHYYNQNTPIKDMVANNVHDEHRAKLERAEHFTDLLRTLQLPYSPQKDSSSKKSRWWNPQFNWIKTKKTKEDSEVGKEQGEYLYSATLLREAGVKFTVSSSKCLLDIEFNKNNGKLQIPTLRLDEWTEAFFRNVMAWEQSFYPYETHICDYIFLMKYLIKSKEDVGLLVRKRIIINQIGSHEAVVTLFDDFCKHINPAEKNRYSDIFMELNAYNTVRHHSWIAILRLQYFSTLWTGVATVAAIILLVLTLIQTICSVISIA